MHILHLAFLESMPPSQLPPFPVTLPDRQVCSGSDGGADQTRVTRQRQILPPAQLSGDRPLTVVIVVGGGLVLARVAVGGVADHHRGLADGAVAHQHTLDALGRRRRRRLAGHDRAARRTGASLNQHGSPPQPGRRGITADGDRGGSPADPYATIRRPRGSTHVFHNLILHACKEAFISEIDSNCPSAYPSFIHFRSSNYLKYLFFLCIKLKTLKEDLEHMTNFQIVHKYNSWNSFW